MISSKIDVDSEKKFLATEQTAVGIGSSGTVYDISAISQGTSDSNRVGDSVTLDRLRLSYAWAAGDTTNVCRLVVFQWNVQSTPLISSVLLYSSALLVPYAMPAIDTQKEFKILYDRSDYISTSSPTIAGDIVEIKMPGKIQFQAGSSSSGTGKIYMIAVSDSSASPNPELAFQSTLYYYDA
jgi:hypothetical protein